MIEKVNPMHPDKQADRIAGAIVDLAYKKENNPKIGVHISEMDLLTIGEINDMYIEMQNDEVPEAYNNIPTQRDFDMF